MLWRETLFAFRSLAFTGPGVVTSMVNLIVRLPEAVVREVERYYVRLCL